ncbi:MAG: MATE family efflux transporter [Clostridia bacterium]|nr:MATE family efflux transporter [Clostridia bacterium]
MSAQDAHYKRMMETPIPKLITSLAVPTVISMLVTNVYNMVDTFFVSRLGTSASGAVGITATLSLILLTSGLTFGHGAGSIISRALGGRQEKQASILASTAFFSAFAIGAVLSVFGILFLEPLMYLLGSTKTVLPYAKGYGLYILLAAPFTVSGFVLNNIMRYEGKANLAMVGLTTGAVLNMALDPLFIFGFGMGVQGAGLSTALSQVISFGILLFMYVSGRTRCKIAFQNYRIGEVLAILKNGLPTMARQGMNCFSSLLLNRSAAVFGDTALAAVSIVNQICGFIMSVMIGIGQGYQPVAGFTYGAKRLDRLKSGFYFTFLLGETVLFTLSLIFFFGASPLVSAFRDDAAVVQIGALMLKLQCISLIVQPYVTCANMMFQSIGETGRATLLATTRNGLYMIPLLLVLPHVFGLTGILICQPLADIFSLITALPLVIRFFQRTKAVSE